MLLLDTNALLWSLFADRRLGKIASRTIDEYGKKSSLTVSAVSFWEVALLAGKRKIALDVEPILWRRRVLALGIKELPLTGSESIEAASLTDFQRDPADRFIVATARLTNSTLLTSDAQILGWSGKLERSDARK